MTWVRTTDVRPWNGGLRWTLAVEGGNVVTADTTRGGTCLGLQSLERINGTGDAELNDRVLAHIHDSLAQRNTHRRLDQLDGRRWGRVPALADRGWGA